MKSRALVASAAVLALAGGVAACGDDDDDHQRHHRPDDDYRSAPAVTSEDQGSDRYGGRRFLITSRSDSRPPTEPNRRPASTDVPAGRRFRVRTPTHKERKMQHGAYTAR